MTKLSKLYISLSINYYSMTDDFASSILSGDRRAIAKAISMIENEDPKIDNVISQLYPKTGNAFIVDTDTSDNAEGFMTAAASDTITLNGSTKGGKAGTIITCKAIGANRWGVQVTSGGTGDLATPFSAAVS